MNNEVQMRRRIRQIWADCDAEGRDATLSERHEIESLLDAIEGRKSATRAYLEGDPYGRDFGFGQGAGDIFVKSSGWRQIADPTSRPQKWSTGMIEVGQMSAGMLIKGTLLEGSGAPGSGSGGGFVPVPQTSQAPQDD